MNRKIPYVDSELNVVDTLPGFFGGPGTPVRNTPVSPKENMAALFFDRNPYWLPAGGDSGMFISNLYNDKLGRGGFGSGTTDAFGLTWEWIEEAGGSIVRPGKPLLDDANDWEKIIKIPDIDEWDWAADAEKTPIDIKRSFQMSFVNGFWFERLISFMDFAPAAMALIDESQTDAIMSLFEATTDLAIRLVDKFCEYYPTLDGFNIHDDWGSQMAPFFSEKVAQELFVPHMRRLTDHIHSKGRCATLHSCGHTEARVQSYIYGGFDQWDPQLMNDTHKLYDEYGDKIIISVVPEPYDVAASDEAEQRRRAREYVERFCNPGKPTILGHYGNAFVTPAFAEEVYIHSRKRCAEF